MDGRGRGIMLAIGAAIAAVAVACGSTSPAVAVPRPAGDAVQATPTTPPKTTPTSEPTPVPDEAGEQVGLDPDVDPPDLLNPKRGRRIIKLSQTNGDGVKERTLEIVNILPRDAIPAIDDPRFITADEASENLLDTDTVIGVSINGDHKAYSTAFLSAHEIVNDTVGGKPVAVTW